MLKSLQTKLVLILMLLIISVMLVVGTFLLINVSQFFHDDFKLQISSVMNEKFINDLKETASSGEYAYNTIKNILANAYGGALGISSSRNFYILDMMTGQILNGSRDAPGESLEMTPNLIAAMSGKVGAETRRSDSYLDYAVPIETDGGRDLIIYIKDTKEELGEMTWMLFAIIIQALFFGLIIAVVLSLFLSKAITDPIQSITKGATRLASGDFSNTLKVQSNDEIGTLTETFNTMADVLKNTLDDVEGERNKLSTIFEFLADGVFAFSFDGWPLHMNKAAMEMMEIEGSDGINFGRLFDNETVGVSLSDVMALSVSENLIKDVELKNKYLKIYFAKFETESRSQNAITGGIIAVIHDITEQQILERSRRTFVANVSHELRTPLTSIKSYTETVYETPDLSPEITKKFLGVVLAETDRMARIVKDLLVLSRIDNNRMDWSFGKFSMDRLIESIYEVMLMDAKNNDIELKLSVLGKLGEIIGDRDRVEQVIINILSNAIKYTQRGGLVEIEAFATPNKVTVKISDTGIGIPKDDIPHLFERFYRVDKDRSRERGGTGLGLAIAKEIVDAHKGEISISSELNKGTTMTVILNREI